MLVLRAWLLSGIVIEFAVSCVPRDEYSARGLWGQAGCPGELQAACTSKTLQQVL